MEQEKVVSYFAALAAAHGIVSSIDAAITKYSITTGDNVERDATGELREHQIHIIKILEEITHGKDRRKTPRRP